MNDKEIKSRVLQIENISYNELILGLGDWIGGRFVNVNDVPGVEMNKKQTAHFLGISENTVIKFMERGELSNIGTGSTLKFSLQQLFLVKPDVEKLRYQRVHD